MSVVEQRDELKRLAGVAERLGRDLDADAPDDAGKAREIAERLREARFDIAVVGEFNRGKSTLLNKLLQNMVLPSGVLPVTSILTEVAYGDREQVNVIYEDGRDQVIDLTEIDKYVTEEENPGNKHNIAHVRVTMPSSILRNGAVLVDTPGVGSIFRHNSELAREMMVRADGAIMVMSADEPITDTERSLIRLLAQRSQRTFFVLNRIDHLEGDELERVTWFVGNVLEEACGTPQRLYAMSARHTDAGFDAFVDDFGTFLNDELDGAKTALALHDIRTLADRIENESTIELSAMGLTQTELEDRIDQFRKSIDWQHESFADDKIIFEHAGNRAVAEVTERLDGEGTPGEAVLTRVHEAVADVSHNELEAAIDRAIEAEVKAAVEPLRRREDVEVERAWRKAADRFERATQRRADKLRDIAGDLFDVELKPVHAAEPAAQRGRFFYSPPVHQEQQVGAFRKMLRPFTSERRSRARLLSAGDDRLATELRTHLSRLGDDLRQRVADANAAFEKAMEERVNEVAHAMMLAMQRAQAMSSDGESENRERVARIERIRERARTAHRSTSN
jgi:GTPase Era involved in 16S rRNA processing